MVGGYNGPALVDFFPNDVTSKTDAVAKRIAEEAEKQRAAEAEKARIAKLETDFKALGEEKKKLVEANNKLGLEKQTLDGQVKTLTETKNKWDEAEKKKLDDDNNLDSSWHGATVTIFNCATKLVVDAGHGEHFGHFLCTHVGSLTRLPISKRRALLGLYVWQSLTKRQPDIQAAKDRLA